MSRLTEIKKRHDELHGYLTGKTGTIRLDPEQIHDDRGELIAMVEAAEKKIERDSVQLKGVIQLGIQQSETIESISKLSTYGKGQYVSHRELQEKLNHG
jgi:hypothetical protein